VTVVCVFLCVCAGQESVGQIVEEHSYSDRLKKSIAEVICGLLLIIIVPVFLWLTEKKVVRYDMMINRCQIAVREVPNSAVVSRRYESRPVMVKGSTRVDDRNGVLRDEVFGFTPEVSSVRLRRTVEMYQWVEDKEEQDSRTVYSYRKEWLEIDTDSDSFRDPSYANPPRQPCVYSTVFNAESVYIGAYRLLDLQVSKLHRFRPCTLPCIPSSALVGYPHLSPHIEKASRSHMELFSAGSELSLPSWGGTCEYLVFNGTISNPQIGTIRVSYDAVPAGSPVTTIAVQHGESFRPFSEEDAHSTDLLATCGHVSLDEGECVECCCCCTVIGGCAEPCAGALVGSEVCLVEERLTDIKTMFQDERSNLRCRLLLVRLVCYLLLSIGIFLVLKPIAVLLSFIPLLGGLIANVLWVASLITGFLIGMVVTSVAWITYRPYMLTVLLVGTGVASLLVAKTSNAILVGKVLCGLALFPAALVLLQAVDQCRFVAAQRELDRQEQRDYGWNKNDETTQLLSRV